MKAIFDTNILIDYLNGETKAYKEMSKFDICQISIISYIEVLVGVQIEDAGEAKAVKNWLSSFQVINIDGAIAEVAIKICKQYKLKVPNALILATAYYNGAVLVTRNTKDFNVDMPLVRVPYTLNNILHNPWFDKKVWGCTR